MRIGVDLDGVIYNSENLIRARSEIFDIEINGRGVVNPDAWLVQGKYDWNNEEKEKFFDILCESAKEATLMPLAKEVISKLIDEGHEIYIITARGCVGDKLKEFTKEALKRDCINYSKLAFCETSKLDICLKSKIQLMIDDRPSIINELSKEQIKCLYFRDAESEIIDNENTIMVYNWGQIYRVIRGLN